MRSRRVRVGQARGSHLPVLMKLLSMTTGPVLELGCGYNSTPVMHWACFPTSRRLLTMESNPDFFEFANAYIADFHEVRCVPTWDSVSVDVSEPWSLALVDHSPETARAPLAGRLAHAEYVIVHDTQRQRDGRTPRFPEFKFEWKYTQPRVHTSVLSNVHDLKGFTIP